MLMHDLNHSTIEQPLERAYVSEREREKHPTPFPHTASTSNCKYKR